MKVFMSIFLLSIFALSIASYIRENHDELNEIKRWLQRATQKRNGDSGTNHTTSFMASMTDEERTEILYLSVPLVYRRHKGDGHEKRKQTMMNQALPSFWGSSANTGKILLISQNNTKGNTIIVRTPPNPSLKVSQLSGMIGMW